MRARGARPRGGPGVARRLPRRHPRCAPSSAAVVGRERSSPGWARTSRIAARWRKRIASGEPMGVVPGRCLAAGGARRGARRGRDRRRGDAARERVGRRAGHAAAGGAGPEPEATAAAEPPAEAPTTDEAPGGSEPQLSVGLPTEPAPTAEPASSDEPESPAQAIAQPGAVSAERGAPIVAATRDGVRIVREGGHVGLRRRLRAGAGGSRRRHRQRRQQRGGGDRHARAGGGRRHRGGGRGAHGPGSWTTPVPVPGGSPQGMSWDGSVISFLQDTDGPGRYLAVPLDAPDAQPTPSTRGA